MGNSVSSAKYNLGMKLWIYLLPSLFVFDAVAFNEISELGELLSNFMDRGWDGDFEDLSDLIHQLMEEAQDIPIDDYDEPGYDLE